jgi:hypothetical protein
MILDIPVNCTTTSANFKEVITNVRYIPKDKSVRFYSNQSVSILKLNTGYTMPIIKKRIPAPDNLKRAMFRISSKGIASALQK